MKHLEQEFKWNANSPRSFARMLGALRKEAKNILAISSPEKLHIEDMYLDDKVGTLERHKIALRIRNTDGVFEATFKTKTELVNGKAVRREETLPLGSAHDFSSALNYLAAQKKWEGITLEGLGVLFVLKNKRVVRQLHLDAQTSAEMAFDDCQILVAGRTLLMKEIELEFKGGDEDVFSVFAERLTAKSGLNPAAISKVKTALALRHILEGK